MRTMWLGAAVLTSAMVHAEAIDNCASLLGSMSVELRYARTLPADTPTTFVCPKDLRAVHGASRQRIVNALGAPDLSTTSAPDGPPGSSRWSYHFASAHGDRLARGVPTLSFDFDQNQNVVEAACERNPG